MPATRRTPGTSSGSPRPTPTTVTFELCRPDVAFLPKIAAPAFAINDTAWLEAHVGDGQGGEASIVSEVNGTGPYRSEGWHRGSEISLARNDAYWGTQARNERLIVRWRDPASARLVELQNATVDGIDDLEPSAIAAVEEDVSLQPAPREGLNVVYLGFTATFAPFDIKLVRRAIAMGIDRPRLVSTFFPPGSAVATHYTPCAIPHGCAGDPWYEFDPLQAKDLLATAGYADGFETSIRYRGRAQPGAARSGRRRPGAQGAAPHEPRDPGRARGRAGGRRTWPISPPASAMASTCPARR